MSSKRSSETRTGTNAFTASHTVDGEGNRTSQTINGTTTSFTLNDDYELTATSGGFSNSYSYNANGEQTGRTLSGTAYTLGYDYEGQLTQITHGQNTTDFVYDALGRRYSRTAGGTATVFYYAGSQVLLEKQGETFTGVYTYGNSLLRRNSEYPPYDGHGSERTVTASSQSVSGTINFEAFGQTAGSTGSSSSPYMYAGAWGYRTDGDAGLMHVGARYYDAQVGRFITADEDLEEHPYLSCDHDPANWVDPDGYNAELVLRAGASIAGGASIIPGGQVVATVVLVGVGAYVVADAIYDWWQSRPRDASISYAKPHTSGARPSTHDQHTRKRLGASEKGDKRRKDPPPKKKGGPHYPKGGRR